MKTMVQFLFLILLGSSVSMAGELFSITPAQPKNGDVVTLTYDPSAEKAVHKDASDVYAVILFLHVDDVPTMLEKKMEKTGSLWSTSFTVNDPKAVSFSFRFDAAEAIDDNGAKVRNVLLTGAKGKPVPGALFMQGMLQLQKNFYGMKHELDTAKAKALLRQELKSYPDSWRAHNLLWSIEWKEESGEKTKKRIAKELATVYAKQKNNEEAVRELIPWFVKTGQEKKAEEIESAWIRKNPSGLVAEGKARLNFIKEQDQAKRALLAGSYVETFAVQRGLEPIFLSAFLRVKDYDKAAAFLEQYPNVSSNYYNSVGYGYIGKGEQVEKGTLIAKKGLDRLTDADVRTSLDFVMVTRKSWKENTKYLRGMIADTYGEGLMKLGKYTEAETVMEESNALMEGDDPDNNARLAECYVKNGKNDKAIALSYASLIKGKGNQLLIDHYRTAYTAVKGSAAGFDSVLNVAKAEMKKELAAKLTKEKIDKPSIDFELKSIDGKMVKLSDLKGKVVVLDFWATWCGPCLASFPSLQKVHDRYKDNPNVIILAMNTWERVKPEDREQHVKDFIAKNKYTFPVLFDTDLVSQYGVEGIPTKFIIDKNGRIRFKDVGFGGAQEMEDKMDLQFEMLLKDDVSMAK